MFLLAGEQLRAGATLHGDLTGRAPRVSFEPHLIQVSAGDISDAVRVLAYLFGGVETPPCVDSGDINDDGAINITDAIFLLNYLFVGNLELPAPAGGACGEDPSEDPLGCVVSAACN